MKMNIRKLYITWQHFDRLVDKLASEIKVYKKGNIPLTSAITAIITKSRGGFPVATALAHRLNIKNVHEFIPEHYDFKAMREKNQIFLIVDDIADSGKTMFNMVTEIGIEHCYCAVLHYKLERSRIRPDFFGELVDLQTWVIYPYETDETSKVDYEEKEPVEDHIALPDEKGSHE